MFHVFAWPMIKKNKDTNTKPPPLGHNTSLLMLMLLDTIDKPEEDKKRVFLVGWENMIVVCTRAKIAIIKMNILYI